MPAKFVLSKARTGKFSFSLVATNGKVIATSIAYGTKRAALSGIRTVQQTGATAVLDDQTKTAEEAKPRVATRRGSAAGGTATTEDAAGKTRSTTRRASTRRTTAASGTGSASKTSGTRRTRTARTGAARTSAPRSSTARNTSGAREAHSPRAAS